MSVKSIKIFDDGSMIHRATILFSDNSRKHITDYHQVKAMQKYLGEHRGEKDRYQRAYELIADNPIDNVLTFRDALDNLNTSYTVDTLTISPIYADSGCVNFSSAPPSVEYPKDLECFECGDAISHPQNIENYLGAGECQKYVDYCKEIGEKPHIYCCACFDPMQADPSTQNRYRSMLRYYISAKIKYDKNIEKEKELAKREKELDEALRLYSGGERK